MVSNFNRGKFVILKTHSDINDPSVVDRSRYLISERDASLPKSYI